MLTPSSSVNLGQLDWCPDDSDVHSRTVMFTLDDVLKYCFTQFESSESVISFCSFTLLIVMFNSSMSHFSNVLCISFEFHESTYMHSLDFEKGLWLSGSISKMILKRWSLSPPPGCLWKYCRLPTSTRPGGLEASPLLFVKILWNGPWNRIWSIGSTPILSDSRVYFLPSIILAT
jgi:hypothetical protein